MNKKITVSYKIINVIFFIILCSIVLFFVFCVEIFYKKEFIRSKIYGFSERELKLYLLKNNEVNNVIIGPSSSTTMSPDVFNHYKINKKGFQTNDEFEVSKAKNLNLSIGGGTIKEFYSYIDFLTKNHKTKSIVLNLRIQSFKDGFDFKNMPIDFSRSLDEFSLLVSFQNFLEKNLSEIFSSSKVKFVLKKFFLKEHDFKDAYNKNKTEEEYLYKGIRYYPDFFLTNTSKVSSSKNIREKTINLDELDVNLSKNFKYIKKIIDLCNTYNIDLFIVFDPLAINKLSYDNYSYQKKEIELIKLILDIYPEVYYFNNHNQINNELNFFPHDWVHYNYEAANIVLNEVLSGDLKNGIRLNKEKLILLENKLFTN